LKFGVEKTKIEIVESINIHDILKERENFHIKNNNVVNKYLACFDKDTHKKNLKKALNKYIEKNKEKYLEYQRNYQKKRYWTNSEYNQYLNQKSKERYYNIKQFNDEFQRLCKITID
jgi:hypothetical protein